MRTGDHHVADLVTALSTMDCSRLTRWGRHLGSVLAAGHRVLVAGNGGSAAEAQHLTAELVGRYLNDRQPLSALALHADTSTMTALGNDFGFDEVFARQVRAHGRPGDVLIALSTSGRSGNLLVAVRAARSVGMATWALTGGAPNPLADACDEYVDIASVSAANVQECHLVAVHIVCAGVDAVLDDTPDLSVDHPTWSPLMPQPSSIDASAATQPQRGPRRAARLVVVGDTLLDATLTGEVDRVSPEAPVPVVSSPRRHLRPGGAGLAALLAAGDGHAVTLVTALGSDRAAETVQTALRDAGVTVINLGTTASTPVKTRIRAGQQTVLRLDQVSPPQRPGPLSAEGRAAIQSASAVLVSDYGRGLAATDDVRDVVAGMIGRVPIVWDPHPAGPAPVAGITVATPNQREAHHFAPDVPLAGLAGDVERARCLRATWDVGYVAVTRGHEGAVMIADPATPPLVVGSPARSAGDSCGAGDRLAGALAAALGAGAVPPEALSYAVVAATDFVGGGQVPMAARTDRPAGAQDAVALAGRLRAAGRTVVATGGCFDLVHRGHIALLQQARQLGDCLIVCLNSDASVRRHKGEGRPLVSAEDRAGVLAALSSVDAVYIFDEDTPEQALERLRPHVYVKGSDYAISDIPERTVVEECGGHVVLIPYLRGRSTTSLIEQAVRNHSDSVGVR